MKFPQLFTKIPKHKRFDYVPRHYDPQEEERRERELRIRMELKQEGLLKEEGREEDPMTDYRSRIAGSFKSAKRTSTAQSDPSASMLRLIITLILTVGLIAFLQYGKNALIGLALVFIPFYLYLKFRKSRR
jgi:Flp pilus assembly protein TadB